MENVGIFLKKEREANNISLRELAEITKITPVYLELIEKNEFDKIPQGPYIKGYLSSYSQAVGCDVDKAIRLYTIAARKRAEAEELPPETISNKTGKNAAEAPEPIEPTPSSRLQLDKLGSGFTNIASSVLARAVSLRAAQNENGITASSETHPGKPSRQSAGCDHPSRLSGIVARWSTGRRSRRIAVVALSGAVLLLLAGSGYYLYALHTPETASVVEAEAFRDQEGPRLPAAGPQPSASPSTTAIATTATPQEDYTERAVSGPVGSDTAASGAQPEVEGSADITGPAESNGRSASGSSLSPPQAPTIRDHTVVDSGGPSDPLPILRNSSPKPAVVHASPRVSKAAICRAIENRMPAGIDRSFPTSDGKIFVWSQIAGGQVPSKIHHIYYFGGKKISDIALDVRSSNWRTWSSKTIADKGHRGEWRVDIATSEGEVLRQLFYVVK